MPASVVLVRHPTFFVVDGLGRNVSPRRVTLKVDKRLGLLLEIFSQVVFFLGPPQEECSTDRTMHAFQEKAFQNLLIVDRAAPQCSRS